ncbi:hypothetical protein NXV08_12990 [Bacteroides fragilis]|nr:hypothetical protein [Bacteroides fragilis]
MADELGALKPYFADGVAETEQEKMDELYGIFHRDFFENTVIIDGIPLKVKPYLYKNSEKIIFPLILNGTVRNLFMWLLVLSKVESIKLLVKYESFVKKELIGYIG